MSLKRHELLRSCHYLSETRWVRAAFSGIVSPKSAYVERLWPAQGDNARKRGCKKEWRKLLSMRITAAQMKYDSAVTYCHLLTGISRENQKRLKDVAGSGYRIVDVQPRLTGFTARAA